jgi:glycosyltransferase involved in cell wall biosynthesis
MELKCGFAISTYHTRHHRLHVFKTCITSIMTTKKKNTVVIIVDDGSPITEHLDWVKSQYPTIKCVRKSENGGIAKCKNTCLRELNDAGCDVFFLFDDDVSLLQSIEDKYVAAIQEEDVYVLSGVSHGNTVLCEFTSNTVRTHLLNGFLLCFTAETFATAGYFKIFPEKYGHEHTWYTYRIMRVTGQPGFLDISGGENLYRMLDTAGSLEHAYVMYSIGVNSQVDLSVGVFMDCIE